MPSESFWNHRSDSEAREIRGRNTKKDFAVEEIEKTDGNRVLSKVKRCFHLTNDHERRSWHLAQRMLGRFRILIIE